MDNRITIQFADRSMPDGPFDVLVNGDHFMQYATKAEAEAGALQATNGVTGVQITDCTTQPFTTIIT